MLPLYTLLLSSGPLLITPDTTLSSLPVRQILKLGVHGFDTETVALTYERQLTEQWSVLGSMGYYGYSFRGSTVFYDDYGMSINTDYMRQTRHHIASAQLRHYFRSRRPRPLTGWFAAANLQLTQQTSRGRYDNYPQQNYTYRNTSGQLQLLLGRQWALGRRLTLDSYVGVSLRRRLSAAVGYARPVLVEGGLGLQVGYRFRPLPR